MSKVAQPTTEVKPFALRFAEPIKDPQFPVYMSPSIPSPTQTGATPGGDIEWTNDD